MMCNKRGVLYMKYTYSKIRKVKDSIKVKSIFKKLLFSYIIIISFILLISALILYQGYKKQVVSQSKITSQKLLNQAEYYSKYNLYWARSYLYQLYLNDDVYNLMFGPNTDVNEVSNGIRKISQASRELPSVQSIYVYNFETRTIYPSFGSPSNYSIFFDKDIEKLIKENTETMSTNFIPRKIDIDINGQKYTKNLLTLFLTNIKSNDDNMPYGAIILNLDAESIEDYYRSIAEDDYNIFAIDSIGRVILNSDPGLFLEDISSKYYIKKILKSGNKSGSFLSDVDGKYSLVFYKTSDRLNLKFVNVIPYNKLLIRMNEMLKLVIITSIILFIVGIIISFFYSKGIYLPIDRTVKTVKKYIDSDDNFDPSLNIEGINENEIDYLSKMIDVIISKPISLKKLPESDLSFIKKQLLTGLLYNAYSEIDNLRNKLKELEMNIDFTNIMVLLFKIDSYNKLKERNTKDECELIKNEICIESSRVMMEHYKNEYVILDDDEFCLIISIGESINNGTMENLIKTIEDIQNAAESKYDIKISAAIGEYVYDIQDTSKSFKSSQEYMLYRLKYGFKSILYNKKISEDICGQYQYREDIEDKIFKGLKTGDLDKVKIELDRMFEDIARLSYNDMVLAISELENNSKKVIENINHMNKNNASINYKQICSNLCILQTLDSVKNSFLELFKDEIEQNKAKNIDEKSKVIESIKKYVNDNYSDSMLSVETIAESVKLSANYIRILFKEIEGKSLSNYISEVRFEKAKSLLESTDLTVMKISEEVGFANYNYFYTAFKKFYGISPNKYRNNLNI